MQQFNYLQAIFMSFYSRNLYKDVIINWGAGAVLYLFLLLAICWAVTIVRVQPIINKSFNTFVEKYSSQIPSLKFKNGQVTTPDKKAYIIRDPEDNKVFGIIDTSGQYPDLEKAPVGTQLLMTSTQIFYRDKANQVKIQKIPTNFTYEIKPNETKSSLVHIVNWGWILLYPVLLFLSFIYRLIQALVYAVFGKIFAALSNNPLSYATILKLSMVSITPVIVISTILDVFGIDFYFDWLFYFLLAMIYLVFALGANKYTEVKE